MNKGLGIRGHHGFRAWTQSAMSAARSTWYQSYGYTIVEVMIVLAITGALIVSAMVMIAGQQGKTEFTQAVNDIQAQINDVINNVSTGFYANNGNVSCTGSGSSPTLSVTSKAQGTNQGCVFIGRAMQFAVAPSLGSSDPTAFNIYDIVGLQNNISGQAAQTLAETAPKAIAPPNGADTTQSNKLQYGLQAAKMYYTNVGSPTAVNTVAFISTLASYSNGNLASGSQQVELRPVITTADISNGPSDKTAAAAVSKITAANLSLIPDGGVTICFNSAGSNQNGTVKIGSNGRQLTTTLTISAGNCL